MSRVVYTVTFVIGAMLGALGGAIMAPKIAVTLGIGVEVIVLAFAVVAIGGMGSIEGALVGALIVGICRAAAVHLVPQIELFVIYGVMALVLVVRPYGLFVRAAAEKNLTWHGAALDRGEFGFRWSAAAAAWRAAGLDHLARHHRLCQRTGGARPDRDVAGRPRLVRAGAVLLHRRLCRGADRPLDRRHRRLRCWC